MIGNIIGYLVVGLIAGAIAKLIMPGKQGGGCIGTSLLGIGGSLIGGFIGKAIGFLPDRNPNDWLPGAGGMITAVLGALLLLFIFAKVLKK